MSLPSNGAPHGKGVVLKNRGIFGVIIFVSAVVTTVVNLLFLFLFRSPSAVLNPFLLRVGLPGLGYILLVTFVLGRSAVFFDPACFAVPGEAYVRALKKLGAVPVKMIALTVLFDLAFLGLIFMQGEKVGIRQEIHIPLFFAALSLGMLIGTFVYVLADSLVSKTLISGNLAVYPRDLRENRQGLKLLIVPIAVALLSILFTFSITLLVTNNAGVSLSGMDPQAWWWILVLSGVFFVSVALLASILKNNARLTFNSIIVQLENLSSAKKDLVKRISICSVDELGTIAGMVNSFCDNMGSGIREIKDGQYKLAASSVELEQNAADMAISVSQISGGTEMVRSRVQNQKQSVSESSAAVEEIARNIESLNDAISRQSSSVGEASAAVEEMVGNIESIGGMVEKMLDQFRTVNDAASSGGVIQKESGEKVQEIVEESRALQEANKIIATIAAQTNLLAMNAAIEAAHAGDAGRGFSVVADEIRKLAENSARESQKIGTELKQITQTINSMVTGAKASEQAFDQVSLRVEETEKLVSGLNNAIREQQKGAGEVLDALKAMNDITAEVRTGSKEMNEGNAAMLQEMNKLRSDSGEISGSIEEMVESLSHVNKNAGQVSVLAANAQSAIKDITVIVDSFEV
jgi:methyl-accepting chemotaxis protein